MNLDASILRRGNGLAWLGAVAGSWLWTVWRLADEWRLSENYRYGFSVPLLLAVLVWVRLPGQNDPPFSPARRPSRRLLVAGLGLFLAAELVREMDPLWRLGHWLAAASATSLTVAWLERLGGAALCRRMAFPLAFAWTALPWPMGIEVPLGNFLMRTVAAAAAEALNVAGVAARQQGNLIVLKNGVLGVDTACSGIQSLQAGLMIALFLGDYLALSRLRRVALLAVSVLCAILGNFARTLALAWALGARGMNAETRLHDPTGYAATVVIFALIVLAALGLRPRGMRREGPAARPPVHRLCDLGGKAGGIVAVFLLLAPLLARGWFEFRGGTHRVRATPLWQIGIPPLPQGWMARPDPIPPATLGMLQCSSGSALALRADDALPAQVVHLFWKPGNFMPSLGYSHTPEICMASAGWELLEGPTPASFSRGDLPMPGALYRFRLDGQRITVFHAVWHGGAPRPVQTLPIALGGRLDRLRQLWEGRRDRGHETLTVALPTLASEEATREEIARILEIFVTPKRATKI